jgi:hypothetical protein
MVISLIALCSCFSCSKILWLYRSTEFTRKGDAWIYYNAIYRIESEDVQTYLKNGADPNYCKGEAGWIDSNPLSVVAQHFYTTFWKEKYGKEIPEVMPDLAIFKLLFDAGADINKRPYIWERIYHSSNRRIASIKRDKLPVEETEKQILDFINSANRILQLFLEKGADPDMLGDPRPYTYAKPGTPDYPMNDEKAKVYFARGTRPINEAIKKGSIWESQVDLLLQYTKLDENSLIAAKESGDLLMIEKISQLWERQKSELTIK